MSKVSADQEWQDPSCQSLGLIVGLFIVPIEDNLYYLSFFQLHKQFSQWWNMEIKTEMIPEQGTVFDCCTGK